MTPVPDPAYLTAVLTLYVELPDTPRRASAYDRTVARSLLAQRASARGKNAPHVLARNDPGNP
jgi:hypothetical protein